MAQSRILDRDVKAVIDTSRDCTPFIDTAQLLVDELLAPSGLTDQRKDKIVTYLAAHFVFFSESNGASRTKIGDTEEDYELRGVVEGKGFSLSKFGKIALTLDTSGLLAAAGANDGLKAKFRVIAQDQFNRGVWGWGW